MTSNRCTRLTPCRFFATLLPLCQEVFSYLDEEEAGQIEYVEFVDAVTLASEQNSNPGPVTWGKIHEDFEYDAEANSVTATGTCVREYV